MGTDDILNNVLPYMRVYSTEWIIQEINVVVLIDSPGQTHSLLLTTTQVDTL